MRIPRKQPTDDHEEPEETTFVPPASPHQKHLRAMTDLAQGSSAWKPASQILLAVRAVKTIFIQFNRATRVGGFPLQRFSVIHGPSNHGKTTFVHGVGLSFLQQGHIYGLVDAEYTTPITWLRELMGDYADHPGFLAMRPESYEQTVDAVEDLVNRLVAAREKEKHPLPESTSAFIAVDSLKKLIPKDIWAKLTKNDANSAKGSVDGMSGRMAQMQAAMNQAWMNRLTPLLNRTNTALMGIARESENIGREQWEPEYKVQGGGAVIYDSSLVVRVIRAGYIRDGKEGPILGERHRLIVNKTKIARKEEKGAVCYFHMSNGAMTPAGFDRARDVLELAKLYKVVETRGAWMAWRSCKWNGDHAAVRKLTEKGLDKLQEDVEAKFSDDDELPTETPEDNIEVTA